MWCPNGHGEFRPHVVRCIDCGSELVDAEPVPERAPTPAAAVEPVAAPVEVLVGAASEVDAAELGLLLRSAGIAHFWSGEDLAVPEDRVDEVHELMEEVGPPGLVSATSTDLARRAFTLGPKARSFLVWGPAVAALWYGSATFETRRREVGAPFADLWKALAVQTLFFVVVGTVSLLANWEVRFHRRAIWLLVAAVAMLMGALLL